MSITYEHLIRTPINQEKQVELEFNPYNKTISNEEKTLDEIIFADDEEIEIEFNDDVYK
jgi:hypothetical protein